MKTTMGIATNNPAASGDESLLGARLRANCELAGGQAAEEGGRPAATAPMPLMSEPVNAWT
jgi:hypothetical protein